MKLLHTADWHLGKRLDSFSRMEEQVRAMDEIVTIADAQAVDLVIIAGDLYDNFNPSVEATELFYKTLKRLSKDGQRPVIAISGNHDAPSLIDAPNPLANACGIILIGHPNAVVRIFDMEHFSITKSDAGFIELKLKSYDFPIRILHTAYANEQRLKINLGEDKEENLNKVLHDHWHDLASKYCDEQGVNLLTAHLYMNKKGVPLLEEPDGEKPIRIGNADMIYAESIPKQIQYTALGHIHSYKNIGSLENPVVYASSPIAYSFSEAGQKKFVQIIDIEPGATAKISSVEINAGRPLCRKTFDQVDDAVEWLEVHQEALVELTIESDTYITTEQRKRLYQAHNGIIFLIPKVTLTTDDMDRYRNEIDLTQDMSDLFKDYFRSKKQQDPNDELMQLFKEIQNL